MSENSERRKNSRALSLDMPLMILLDQRMALIMNNLRFHWAGRIIFALIMILCLGSMWWSINERLPLVKSSHAYIQKVHRMQANIDLLQTQFEQKTMAKYQLDIANFEQSLFPDMETTVEWLQDKMAIANDKNMDFAYTLYPLENAPEELGNIRMLPVIVTLKMTHPHARMNVALTFLDSLVSDGWRVDLISLNMKGEHHKLSQVAATFNIWMENTSALELLTGNQQ